MEEVITLYVDLSHQISTEVMFRFHSLSAVYECQISTQPVRSYFVNLNVVGELEMC